MVAVLLERVLSGTHLEVDMPHDPVVTVLPGRVLIDGRFGVNSADELRPIHVEIAIETLREVASAPRDDDDPYRPTVRAWGDLYTWIQESLAFEASGPDPDGLVVVILP